MCYALIRAAEPLPQVQPDPQPRRRFRSPYRRPRAVPDSELGHCATCGASYREYLECEGNDCTWVRESP